MKKQSAGILPYKFINKQVFFFIAALLPFLLMDRVKMCLLVTYLFTFYLGFMVQWGEYLSSTGSMQPFVL